MRWVLPVALLGLGLCLQVGCSCDEDRGLAADGYVRCHLAPPPEGERRHGSLRLRFEERTLTIEGLPAAPRLAVGAGPIGDARIPQDVDLVVLLGDLGAGQIPQTDALVLLLAGGTDRWEAWSEGLARIGGDRAGVVDATPLRRIVAGPLELVPVAGAPPRYARTDACCGIAADDVDSWQLEPTPEGVHRVLVSWAAPASRGILGVRVEVGPVAAIRSQTGATSALYAWPRLDPESSRPVSGPWVTRAGGSREPPGWSLYVVTEEGLTRRPDSP